MGLLSPYPVVLLSVCASLQQGFHLLASRILWNTQTDIIANHTLLDIIRRNFRRTIRKQCSLISIATRVCLQVIVDHSNQRPLFLSHYRLCFALTIDLLIVESFFDFFASLCVTIWNRER